jgi:hypothetical protein
MQNILLRAKRVSKIAALGILLLVQSGLEAGNGGAAAAGHAWFPDPIEGVWNASVDITNCATGNTIASFEAIGMFAANGTFHDTNSTNPALKSSTFGYWRSLGNNEYQFAWRQFTFDAAGVNTGSLIVRHDVLLSADGASYFSEGTGEFFDPAGNLVSTVCSSAAATRFE